MSEAQWKSAVQALCRNYEQSLNGRIDDERLTHNAMVSKLINESRTANARQHLAQFCTPTPQRRFRPVAGKTRKLPT